IASNPPAAMTLVSGPNPAGFNLTPVAGITNSFTYIFEAQQSGTVTFSAVVKGYDENTKITKTAAAAVLGQVIVKTVPVVEVEIQSAQMSIPAGGNVTFTAQVRNVNA